MSRNCCGPNNYTASHISKSGLKCFPYTFTLKGILTDNGITLKGLSPSVAYNAPQQAPVVALPKSSCCN